MNLPFGKIALLLGAAAMMAPVATSAQEVRDLDSARSDVMIFEGTITTTPARFRYTIQPGTALTVDVVPTEGSELDPVLTITDLATGEVLAEDDDSGGNLASRARITSDVLREVEITVSAFAFFSGEESTGAFELQLRPRAWVRQPTEAIAWGGEARGRVSEGAERLYTISGEEGQLLEVALIARNDDFDPMLRLYRGEGSEGEELASDDDGGEGLNSLLRFVLPATGTYTIAAAGYGSSEGPFTLRVREQHGYVLQAPEQVLGMGETASGYLGAGYVEGSPDPATITYQLAPEAIAAIRAGAGEVTINMTSPLIEDEDFPSGVDPMLELGFETPLGFASMMSNDDGGEGLNARIALDLGPVAAEGDWLERLRIRASSISGGGAYAIEMVEGLQEVREPYYEDAAIAPPMPVITPVPAPSRRD